MGRDTLQQSQRIADPVGRGGSQLRRVQQRIDRDNLLEQGSHDTCERASHTLAKNRSRGQEGQTYQKNAR
jgi:hypothetical protein